MPFLSPTLRNRGLVAGGILAACPILACPSAFATSYTYRSIAKTGAIQTNPVGLNASGEVLGYWVDSSYGQHPFTYLKGKITPFSFAAGVNGIQVTGINGSGDICGSYMDANSATHGFVYTAEGKLTTLDVPNGIVTSANAINDLGEVAGTSDVNGYGVAYTYKKGAYTVFTTPAANEFFTPQAINNRGSVAGYQYFQRGAETGFTYINGVYTAVALSNTYFSAVFGINDRNVAAGQLATNSRQEFGFTYTAKGDAKIIGPAGSTNTFSLSINDSGVVTGTATNSDGSVTGYTYAKGVYSTLAFGGNSDFSGNFINASGLVLGQYVDASGVVKSFLATPKP